MMPGQDPKKKKMINLISSKFKNCSSNATIKRTKRQTTDKERKYFQSMYLTKDLYPEHKELPKYNNKERNNKGGKKKNLKQTWHQRRHTNASK